MEFVITMLYLVFQYVSVGETFPVLGMFRIQLVLGLAGLAAAGVAILSKTQYVLNSSFWLVLLFTTFAIVSWLPHGWVGGVVFVAQKLLPAAIPFVLAAVSFRSTKRLRIFRAVMFTIAVYLISRGLYDYYATTEETPFVMVQVYEDVGLVTRRVRALGILNDPNGFAQFLLSLLPFAFVRKQITATAKSTWAHALPLVAFFMVGIVMSKSRGALVAVAVLLAVVVRRRMRPVGAFALSALLLVALVGMNFTGGRSISVTGGMDRLNLWSDGLGMFQKSPIWGGGYGSYTDNFRHTAHNSFVLAFAELGLAGYLLWMAAVVTVVLQLQAVMKEPTLTTGSGPELKSWARACLLAIYGFLVTGFFLSETYSPLLFLLLGTGSAIASAAAEQSRRFSFVPATARWATMSVMFCGASIVLVWMMVRARGL